MPRRPSPGQVTSPFGWRVHPVTGVRKHHDGIDMGWGNGRTLVAPESGTVIAYADRGGYGRRIDFRGDSGALHYLAHTESISVPVGSRQAEGNPIGVMGNTGLSTGTHLHWEVRIDGQLIDPAGWLARTTGTAQEENDMTPAEMIKALTDYRPFPNKRNIFDQLIFLAGMTAIAATRELDASGSGATAEQIVDEVAKRLQD